MYSVEVDRDAESQLSALHPKRFEQVVLRIYALQQNPRPPDGTILDADTCRVRVGPYSILYHVDDSAQRIRIILIKEQMAAE